MKTLKEIADEKKHSTKSKIKTYPKNKNKNLPLFNIILIDDNEHTVDYVVEMMLKLFSYPVKRGVTIANLVHNDGKCIVLTCHKELAELKRDQILEYGPDPRVKESKGSMKAVIEPICD